MEITYNNLSSPSNIITFTDIPNILKVSDDSGGTYTAIDLKFIGNLKSVTSADSQWQVTLLGETISNVLDPRNAVNKNFYVSSQNLSTAMSMVKAFRNCPTVAANFDVDINDLGSNNCTITITAKSVGSIFPSSSTLPTTTIPFAYLEIAVHDGTSYSDLNGALIDVDVYTSTYEGNKYITTLEKNWYNGEAAFNMSPVLTTISSVGEVVPYNFRISSIKNGEYALLGEIVNNYSTVGYMCNQGYKFIPNTEVNFAQNFSRGTTREFENNTLLYIYYPTVHLSFFNGTSYSLDITIEYLDSAYNQIGSGSTIWMYQGNILNDLYLPLDEETFAQAFYVDVTLTSTLGAKKVRYNVIKPLKATEYCQRILWRNSYGGISFFDFTGAKTETRDVDISTFQKNIFGYYNSSKNELEKVYDNEVKYTVTLKSHLFENDGKYTFNDLIQSTEVWTEINGQNYAIILDSVSVEETDNNNIYQATIKYHYSQEPSLI